MLTVRICMILSCPMVIKSMTSKGNFKQIYSHLQQCSLLVPLYGSISRFYLQLSPLILTAGLFWTLLYFLDFLVGFVGEKGILIRPNLCKTIDKKH